MSLHPTKSKCMVIGTPHKTKTADSLSLTINGIALENVTVQKLLGIYIDNNLKWHTQIDYVCKKLNCKISLLKNIMFYLTDEMKRMFYNAYVLPILDYCCHIWGKDNNCYINKVYTLQKRVAKIILKKPTRSSSDGLLRELQWLTFTGRCKYHCATLVYKTRKCMAPCYITELLIFANNEHYSLRSASKHDLCLTKVPRTNYFKESFSYYSMKVWNDIPDDIRNANKLITFKLKYKTHLLKNLSS